MSTNACGICGSTDRPLVGVSGDQPVCEPCLGANVAPGTADDDDPRPIPAETTKRALPPLGAHP